ncbi:MAG: RluA family pseudouridine synthase [Gemmataceae bacterium]|jgi:23S rRNA pseudouridine1911/1915/1917 synthase|nr:RluA family pseudouridine synthase [Gemmataceae bacterium]
MTPDDLNIVYEDNHLIAVSKPALIASAHSDGITETMDQVVKQYLKKKYQKPGKVFLGIVHRLDKPVSGVLLFARTSKAAARISEQFRSGMVEKTYWAVVEGSPLPVFGTLEDWLKKDEQREIVEIAEADTPGAQWAALDFTTKTSHEKLSLLEVRPRTGRKHQIRVQLAHHGHPIYGDLKYGSESLFGKAIALHARKLSFLHPTRLEPITLTAEVPLSWRGKFARLLNGAI